MRWLLLKDLTILGRSRMLSGLLVVYPIAVALLMGFALSSSPAKPVVAFFSGVPKGQGSIALGTQRFDISQQASELTASLRPVHVASRAAAVAMVSSGRAAAAVVVPSDIARQIQALVTTGLGRPTVELFLNTRDPVERDFVQGTIETRIAQIEARVSQQVLKVAITDLQQVLNGGRIELLGQAIELLGLRNSRTIVAATIPALPQRSPLRSALRQVVGFADLAIEGLSFANPVLGSIGQPLTVRQVQLAGATTPLDSYAAAIAVTVSLMVVALLLAAATLALERSENTLARILRSGVSQLRLLGAKVALAAVCAAAMAIVMSLGVSAFLPVGLSRFALWLPAIGFGAVAFAALGALLGAVARELAAAALLVVLVALPVAFIALIPPDAVGGGLRSVLDGLAFVFPFRATLQALTHAFTGTGPGPAGPLAHLAGLAAVFLGLARAAL